MEIQGKARNGMEMQGNGRHGKSRFVSMVLLKMKNVRDGTRSLGWKIGSQ
jgi:hypothetical protein